MNIIRGVDGGQSHIVLGLIFGMGLIKVLGCLLIIEHICGAFLIAFCAGSLGRSSLLCHFRVLTNRPIRTQKLNNLTFSSNKMCRKILLTSC